MHLAVKREKERRKGGKKEGKNGRNGKKDNWHFRTERRKEGNRRTTLARVDGRADAAAFGGANGRGGGAKTQAEEERKRKLAAVNHAPARVIHLKGAVVVSRKG